MSGAIVKRKVKEVPPFTSDDYYFVLGKYKMLCEVHMATLKNFSSDIKFSKPTLMELEMEINEKGYTVNAEDFFNYYESCGWKVGKKPMKSWNAALVTWQKKRDSEKPGLSPNTPRKYEAIRDQQRKNPTLI